MSMKQLLPPVPYNTPVTGPGSMLTVPWTGFFKLLSKGLLNIRGTSSNDDADTGYVGEFVRANPSVAVSVAASGSYATICSISLTAGDWDVDGALHLVTGGATAAAAWFGGVSITAADTDSQNKGGWWGMTETIAGAGTWVSPVSRRRISLSATTTIYLVGTLAYTVAGGAQWGVDSIISARRVR